MFHVLDNLIMFDFRQIKVHRKKVKKAIAKKNRDLADRLLNRPPTYKLDKLVLERYQVKYNCFFRSSSSTVCSINFFFVYSTDILHLLMLFETWMTALHWFICLRHYLLLMVNVLKSIGSITAAGLFCLISQNFLSHMLTGEYRLI